MPSKVIKHGKVSKYFTHQRGNTNSSPKVAAHLKLFNHDDDVCATYKSYVLYILFPLVAQKKQHDALHSCLCFYPHALYATKLTDQHTQSCYPAVDASTQTRDNPGHGQGSTQLHLPPAFHILIFIQNFEARQISTDLFLFTCWSTELLGGCVAHSQPTAIIAQAAQLCHPTGPH